MGFEMRRLFLLLALLLVSGCGGEDQVSSTSQSEEPTNSSATTSEPTSTPAASTPAETPPAPQAKLPFDMPIMPGARYKSGMKFSKGSKRRAPEAIATIIAKGTTLEVIEFYEKALIDHGFTPTVGKNNDESSATVKGVRENGETFSVTSMRGGSKANEGECQTAIVATKPKPKE